jgi:hypothetical protein
MRYHGYYSRRYNNPDFQITKREILFSTIIVCVMIGFGVWISNPILKAASESALKTVSSVTVSDANKFDYIRRTNVGDFLAEGTLHAVKPVTLPELDGNYMEIKKVKEKYTMHVQHYTTTDGKGHTQHHTRTYWSWDVVHRDVYTADSVLFLGVKFALKNVNYSVPCEYKETQKESSHIRYKYYVHPRSVKGVMVGVCDDKTYKELDFTNDTTIEKMIERADKRLNSAPVIFWVLWMLLTAGLVALFYYFENNWLEDETKPKRF